MLYAISGTHSDSIGQYIAGHWQKNADSPLCPPYSAMGWIKDNKLVAQAVFVDYTGSNIEVHFQGISALYYRKIIRDVYTYVFEQLKCNRLSAKIKNDHKKLLRLLPRMGFVYEGTIEAYYGEPDAPIDAISFKLLKPSIIKWL